MGIISLFLNIQYESRLILVGHLGIQRCYVQLRWRLPRLRWRLRRLQRLLRLSTSLWPFCMASPWMGNGWHRFHQLYGNNHRVFYGNNDNNRHGSNGISSEIVAKWKSTLRNI